jgi:hypothetical protein
VAALGPITVRVRRERSLIGADRRKELRGVFQQIGIARRRRPEAVRVLDQSLGGAIKRAGKYVTTDILVSEKVAIRVSPSEAFRRSRVRRQTVRINPYTVESRPAMHLQWAAGDEARIERYEDFVLLAWTSRLSPADAYKWLLNTATPKADIAVDTLVGTYDNPGFIQKRVIRQRPELIRLVRVEDDDLTLVWELVWDGHSNIPRGERALKEAKASEGGFLRGDSSRPELVVMVEDVDKSNMLSIIQQTASTNIAINAQVILDSYR